MPPAPTTDQDAVRQRIGRVGVLDGSFRAGAAAGDGAWPAALEATGVGCLWVPAAAPDLEAVRSLLGATSRCAVGSAVVSVWDAPAPDLAESLGGVAAERFVLGVGISHGPLVEPTGRIYDRPVARLSGYLDELDDAAPGTAARCLLGVNGPRMLELAAGRTAGAIPYLVTPEHTALARSILGAGPVLAPEQKVLLGTDAAAVRALARDRLAVYLGLPNYVANLRRLGLGDDDFAAGGSDRLVDALVAHGDAAAIARRIHEHWDAGADHVALHVLGDRGASPVATVQAVLAAL